MIPEKEFSKMVENFPMVCVDTVIEHEGKVLLIMRKRNPAKGLWWVQGGRVMKNERLEEAARRKAKEESGLEVEIVKKLGVYETIFKESFVPGIKTGTHTVNIAFHVKVVGSAEVKLDRDHSDFKWTDTSEGLHPYLKQIIADAGVFA